MITGIEITVFLVNKNHTTPRVCDPEWHSYQPFYRFKDLISESATGFINSDLWHCLPV